MLKVDCHTHPFEKKQSLEGMREFVLEAERKGFDEICFTEHGELLPGRTAEFFKKYADNALKLKEEFSSPKIHFGIELDFHPDLMDRAAAIIADYPFDCVLGSVHLHTSHYTEDIQGMSFKSIAEFGLKMIQKAVESGLFNTITHFDFFRILADDARVYAPETFKESVIEVFQAMEKHGVCLEVNSSSLRRPFKDLHPTSEILRWAEKFDLRYAYGSDAHEAHLVGAGYDEVMNALSDSQRANLVTFRNGTPRLLS